LADSADTKPSGCLPLLDWLAAPATDAPDDAAPLSDLDADRAARDDVLTEPIERLRRRLAFIARGLMYPGPLDPAHAHMVQTVARLRRRFAERTIRLWGHYGRPGTVLELVPLAPIDIVDLPKNRLQLAGDPGCWCSLEVEEVATEPLPTRPDQPVAKTTPAPVNAAVAKAKTLVTIKAELLRRHQLDGLAGKSYSKIAADMVEFAKPLADATGFRPPKPKHMAALIRDYLREELKIPQGTGGRGRHRRSD